MLGMSSQFMFPGEQCSPGDPGAIAPPPAALVTIQPDKDGGQYSGQGGPGTAGGRVVSVSVQPQDNGPSTPTHGSNNAGDTDQAQDLCGGGPLSNSGISSHSSPDTPGKKERNSRKQCPYCHKGNTIRPLLTLGWYLTIMFF